MSRSREESPDGSVFERRLFAASLVAATLAFAAAFWPYALGRVFLYADLGNFHLPLRMFYAESLRNGTSPLWLPNLFCGFYLHGEGQVGMFHPLHWLLYRVLPLQPAFALEAVLTYPIAGIGMAWFLRRLSLPRDAAAFGGLVFGLSAFFTLRLTHLNVIAVLAHIPWLLALFDLAAAGAGREGARARALAWLGIAALVASQVLLGYPGAVVQSLACVGLYALFVCARERRFAPLAWLTAAVALGILIGAVQLVPTFEVFEASVRGNSSYDFRTRGSLHPANLAQLLLPTLFLHRVFDPRLPNPVELSFYFGSIGPIAAIWISVRRRHLAALRGFVIACAIASATSLVLALGRYGGLYALVSELPLIGQLRVPARYTLLLYLVSATFAAIAFADLARAHTEDEHAQRERRQQARWIWLAPVLAAILATGAGLLRDEGGATQGLAAQIAPPAVVWLGPVLSLACAALFYAAARGARGALLALVFFVTADQTAYAISQWWTVAPKTLESYVKSIPVLPSAPTARTAMAYSDYAKADPNGDVLFHTTTPFIVHGVRLMRGYTGLIPARALSPQSSKTLQAAAVSHWQDGKIVVPFEGALPRFRFVTHASESHDPARDIESIDVATTALVDAPVSLEPGTPGVVVSVREEPGLVRMMVEAPTRQLLVVSETFHPGWSARVGDADAAVVRAYGDFMALVVPAGRHEIALRFAPASFEQGKTLSAVGVGTFLLAGLVALARPRAR